MKVGVWLEDIDFAGALVKGLAAEARHTSFSLVDDRLVGEDFDLILTDRDASDHRWIQLVRNKDEMKVYDGPPYKIFRYQHAREFVNSLIYIYYCETGKSLEFAGETQCKTIVFTSLTGGLDATALALVTGERLYKHFGCRCLYLNLCPIDGSKCFLPGERNKRLLKLLYYLSQDKNFPLSTFIRQHAQIDCIDTSVSNLYFDELDSARLHRLLKKIDELGKYTYLIIDMGNHLSRENKSLLQKAEEIILVSGDSKQIPASFLQSVMDLVHTFPATAALRHHVLNREPFDDSDSQAELQENGLLNLSAMKSIQWEADRLIREMMGPKHDD